MEKMSLEYDGKVAVLKFNHPERLNAIGRQMQADLGEALDEIENNKACRALLLTGTGRGFCSGANLADDTGDKGPKAPGGNLRGVYHPLLLRLRDLEIPMVTAVNGVAAGIGMSFSLMGDIVCAAKEAYFLQAFARIGLIPDGGSTYLLPRMIGWGRAMELAMLAEKLPAEKAFEWGLINRLYDDVDALMSGAHEIANKLAAGPRSLVMIRRAYWNTWHNAFEQQLDLEARLQDESAKTGDSKEGVMAFLEKREAKFTGE